MYNLLDKSKHCTRSFSIKPKIAKITPLFESGGMSLPGNYRPISVLPTLSKNVEKHVATHLYLYLSKLSYSMNHNLVLDINILVKQH